MGFMWALPSSSLWEDENDDFSSALAAKIALALTACSVLHLLPSSKAT